MFRSNRCLSTIFIVLICCFCCCFEFSSANVNWAQISKIMLQKQKGEMEMAKQAATEVIKGKFSGSGDLKGWRFNNHHRSKLAKA